MYNVLIIFRLPLHEYLKTNTWLGLRAGDAHTSRTLAYVVNDEPS